MAANPTETIHGAYSRRVKGVVDWFKNDPWVKGIGRKMGGQPMFDQNKAIGKTILSAKRAAQHKVMRKIGSGAQKIGSGAQNLVKAPWVKFGLKGGGYSAVALGAIAMFSVGMMKGTLNASQEIVAQRQIQDQRYARNITMMSRLGYTSGTSSMTKYGHTTGLSQALSANRHGRGGY